MENNDINKLTDKWHNQFSTIVDDTVLKLNKPRYKCLQHFPGNISFKIGEIYSTNSWGNLINDGVLKSQGTTIKFSFNPILFPMIFKKLEWWEDRLIEEMPKYLRYNTLHSGSRHHQFHNTVIKPFKYHENSVSIVEEQWFENWIAVYISEENWTGVNGSTSSLHINHFIPATEEEFSRCNQ